MAASPLGRAMNTNNSLTLMQRFGRAPIILQAYAMFAIVFTVVDFGSMLAPPLKRAIVPYTGWVPSTIYMFTIYFALTAAMMNMRPLIYGVVFLLGLGVVIGCVDMTTHLNRPSALEATQANPFLAYATQRPIITIVIPLAWLLLLMSPVMWKWTRRPAQRDTNAKQHQFALRDLLYATKVVAVCVALSIGLVGVVKQKKQSLATQQPAQQGASS